MTDKHPGKGSRAEQVVASRRQQRKIEQQKAAQRKRLTQIGAIVVAALVVVGLVVLFTRPDGSNLPAVQAVAAPDAGIPQEGLFIGSPTAKVTIIEYGDYQCPFCATFNTDGFPPMVAEYIATGQVRFEFRPFSFLGKESVDASKAAYCAADQGKFWAMHELIYGNHNGENLGAFSPGRLEDMAELAGLEMSAYTSCFDDQGTADRVDAANQVARDNGISSTPTFVVNGEVMGWPAEGYPVFKQQIDEALAAAS